QQINQGQEQDQWWRVPDSWTDAEPEDDPSLEPPDNMAQPIRGFGKVWRENGFIREALGWATSEEIPYSSQLQQFEGGFMMTGPNDAPIFVLIPSAGDPTTGQHLGPLP
ncbi:MAG: hypothetical protein GYB68_16310, partial [Chloroflexi bacterium]|nr:hypothetical protein [Chloroflexota bacterium]